VTKNTVHNDVYHFDKTNPKVFLYNKLVMKTTNSLQKAGGISAVVASATYLFAMPMTVILKLIIINYAFGIGAIVCWLYLGVFMLRKQALI
jgi:hypothetical protein